MFIAEFYLWLYLRKEKKEKGKQENGKMEMERRKARGEKQEGLRKGGNYIVVIYI